MRAQLVFNTWPLDQLDTNTNIAADTNTDTNANTNTDTSTDTNTDANTDINTIPSGSDDDLRSRN